MINQSHFTRKSLFYKPDFNGAQKSVPLKVGSIFMEGIQICQI